ncbi:MAG: CbtA family protein [Rubrobacter sp.]|nr:CbtA family protein [Rubrobacter sp.]
MLAVCLRRGLAAGLAAGILAGLFALVFAEPAMDRAIDREEHHHGEVFSRAQQKGGLILATALYGASAGGIFGLLAARFGERMPARCERGRSLALAGALFAGAVLLPFLKYPPVPPGGSDPSTLAERTAAYLALVVLGPLSVAVAWRLGGRLAEGALRLPAAALSLAALWGLLLVALPSFRGGGGLPGGLVWEFRIASLATQAVLWGGIGLLFGLMGGRGEGAPS